MATVHGSYTTGGFNPSVPTIISALPGGMNHCPKNKRTHGEEFPHFCTCTVKHKLTSCIGVRDKVMVTVMILNHLY